jgi:hypothetical protein
MFDVLSSSLSSAAGLDPDAGEDGGTGLSNVGGLLSSSHRVAPEKDLCGHIASGPRLFRAFLLFRTEVEAALYWHLRHMVGD